MCICGKKQRVQTGFEPQAARLQSLRTNHSVKGTSHWPSDQSASSTGVQWQERQLMHRYVQSFFFLLVCFANCNCFILSCFRYFGTWFGLGTWECRICPWSNLRSVGLRGPNQCQSWESSATNKSKWFKSYWTLTIFTEEPTDDLVLSNQFSKLQ